MKPAASPLYVGIEHEYQVLDRDQDVDFGQLIHSLGLGRRGLDPGDPNAYRLPAGTVVTVDGTEAEIALPPIPIHQGFECAAIEAAAKARLDLAGRLPDFSLLGYSTHISVSVPAPIVDEVAQLYCIAFAPSMMLLLDRQSSPGLLVRPRSGRLELGGEYLDGSALTVAVAFAAGSVLLCCDVIRRRASLAVPRVAVDLLSDDHRFGWFVSRYAFGGDLYDQRRLTLLETEHGGTLRAQDHLRRSWAAATERLGVHLDPQVGQLGARMVAGERPLPSEGEVEGQSGAQRPATVNPFGDVLRHRVRADFELAPVMATWDTTVLLILDQATFRQLFVNVPRSDLPTFLADLDSGALDGWLRQELSRRPRHRRLRHHSQTRRLGVYDELGCRRDLLAPERAPMRFQQQRQTRRRMRTTWGLAASLPRW